MHQTLSFAGCRGGLRLRWWGLYNLYLLYNTRRYIAAMILLDFLLGIFFSNRRYFWDKDDWFY